MNDSDKELGEILENLINSMVNDSITEHFEGKKPSLVFEDIEDYNRKTGKRFRITKDQKERGLTRDEAFKEVFGQED